MHRMSIPAVRRQRPRADVHDGSVMDARRGAAAGLPVATAGAAMTGHVRRPRRRQPEAAIQRAIVDLLRPLERMGRLSFLHVPNGGARGPGKEAAIMVGLGVRKGVPDVIIVLPAGRIVWLEVKALGGRLSEDQVAWRDRLRAMGHEWHLVDSVDAAIAVIDTLPGVRRAA